MRLSHAVVTKTAFWLANLIIVSVQPNMTQSSHAEVSTMAALS